MPKVSQSVGGSSVSVIMIMMPVMTMIRTVKKQTACHTSRHSHRAADTADRRLRDGLRFK